MSFGRRVGRLTLLVGAVVFVDTMFYGAIAPLLPELERDLGLGKDGAGLLTSAYAIGILVGAVPGGWLAGRLGARLVVLLGLGAMAVAGLAFAFAQTVELLTAARFVQGIGGACTWAAGLGWLASSVPRERRGAALGAALSAGIFGVQLGPLLGALATEIGRAAIFSSTVVFAVALAGWALAIPRPQRSESAVVAPRGAWRDHQLRLSLLLATLPALAFGVIEVLAPLRLDELGASGLAIGGVFFAAAGAEAVVTALSGRASDRWGGRGVARVGLFTGAAAMVAIQLPGDAIGLAVALILGGAALGVLWSPAMAMLSAAADRRGLDQGMAFGYHNLVWGIGFGIGAAGGGALGHVGSDALPYLLVAGVYLLVALMVGAIRRRRESTAGGATVSP